MLTPILRRTFGNAWFLLDFNVFVDFQLRCAMDLLGRTFGNAWFAGIVRPKTKAFQCFLQKYAVLSFKIRCRRSKTIDFWRFVTQKRRTVAQILLFYKFWIENIRKSRASWPDAYLITSVKKASANPYFCFGEASAKISDLVWRAGGHSKKQYK